MHRDDEMSGVPHKNQEMNNLSASGIMMSSQVVNENVATTIRDGFHDSCFDFGVDLLSWLPPWLHAARVALEQADCAVAGLCIPQIGIADHRLRSSPPGVLALPQSCRVRQGSAARTSSRTEITEVNGCGLAQFDDQHRACMLAWRGVRCTPLAVTLIG
jgi:hypothetical protein